MKFIFKKGNNFAGEKSTKKDCPVCFRSFTAYDYLLKRGFAKYCSSKCSGKASTGRLLSQEHKEKLSRVAKAKGFGNWMKGRKLSEVTKGLIGESSRGRRHSLEARRRISESLKGCNSYAWRGGITSKNLAIRNSSEYREWRQAVFQRDNWTCTFCKKRGFRLNADHIKPFSIFPNLRFEIENGRTLCVPCHRTTKTFGMKRTNLEKLYA